MLGITGATVLRPEQKLKDQAAAQLLRLAQQLGLTPAARTRIQIEKPEPADDPLDEFLGKRVSG